MENNEIYLSNLVVILVIGIFISLGFMLLKFSLFSVANNIAIF
jgi:hypothetical protein